MNPDSKCTASQYKEKEKQDIRKKDPDSLSLHSPHPADQALQPLPSVQSQRGKLKIFFGYAAGTGKTWSMLEAGQAAREKGVDVVIGYLEPHDRPETLAKARGLEVIAPAVLDQGSLKLREMDLDAVLERKPQLVLVDELAHTNAGGSRHLKRCQDISELLMHGIDVCTTVNVQHLESLNDLVASITGILVSERIPDDVFDLADQVELVDIEPDDLLERLREGKIYHPDQARLARQNFFTLDNLDALREIAMRRLADRVNKIASGSKARDHVLVCLSSSPSNAGIIRSAARMARAFDARFSALYIQTPQASEMEKEDAARLEENMRLANRLGAGIETVYGEDIAEQIGEYVRISHVSKIVLGRQGRKSAFSYRAPLAEKLSQTAPDAEIFILPDPDIAREAHPRLQGHSRPLRRRRPDPIGGWKGLLEPALILAGTLSLAFGLEALRISETGILTVFVLGSILCALRAVRLWQAALSALGAVLLFGYFFAAPRFSTTLHDPGYLLVFLVLVISSTLIARLAIRQRREARACAQAAARSSLLFEAGQTLQEMDDDAQICSFIARETARVLERRTVFYPNRAGSLGKPIYSSSPDPFLQTREQTVALWTLKNNKRAGASTDTLSAAKGLYLAVRHRRTIYGVLGIELNDEKLSMEQNAMLLSLLGQCGLALENSAIAREKEKTALAAEHEKMKTNLLRSISHDLRTPLTTISASAEMLLHKDCPPETQTGLRQSIYDESIWLKDTVENLLALTRLEEDDVHLCLEPVDLEEAVDEALHHVQTRQNDHPVTAEIEELCMGRLDGRLIVQMLVNLLNNSFQHTPPGTPVALSCRSEDGQIVIDFRDRGPGIDPKKQDHLFEPFASAHSAVADSYRSTGLGLSLVRSIVELHQGRLELQDNHPGVWFTIRLPGAIENPEEIEALETAENPVSPVNPDQTDLNKTVDKVPDPDRTAGKRTGNPTGYRKETENGYERVDPECGR